MARFRNASPLTQVFTLHGIDEMPRTLKPNEEIDVAAETVHHLPWLVPVEA